jgi:hypothetical protein
MLDASAGLPHILGAISVGRLREGTDAVSRGLHVIAAGGFYVPYEALGDSFPALNDKAGNSNGVTAAVQLGLTHRQYQVLQTDPERVFFSATRLGWDCCGQPPDPPGDRRRQPAGHTRWLAGAAPPCHRQ